MCRHAKSFAEGILCNFPDYFFFLTRNSQITVSCFIRSLTVKSAHPTWPPLRWLPFQIAESDLLELTSYIDTTARFDQCIFHYLTFYKGW